MSQPVLPVINISHYPFPGKIWTIRPWPELVLKLSAIVSIAILGIAANASLLRVLLQRRKRPRIGGGSELLVLSAALADLGIGLCCSSLLAGTDLFQNYVFGRIGCKIEGFLQHSLTLAALFSLSALSYDRLRSLDSYTGRISLRRAKLLTLVSWIAALGLAGPLALGRRYHERRWLNYLETFCVDDHLDFPYWHIFVGLGVCAPLILMAVCYSILLIKLNRYERRALKSEHPIAIKYKGKVARVLGLIVLAFILCRMPFTILVIHLSRMSENSIWDHRYRHDELVYWLWWLSRYLVIVNAAINPLLYGCTSSSLRRELTNYPIFSWIISKSQCNPKPIAPRASCIKLPRVEESSFNDRSMERNSCSVSETKNCKKLRFSPTIILNKLGDSSWDHKQNRSADLKF